MLIDRDTVIELLDKKGKKYDDMLTALNTLPKESVFEVVIEDIVTAEYYDESKDELITFEIDFEYNTPTTDRYEIETVGLNNEINKSLKDEYNNSNDYSGDSQLMKLVKILVFAFVTVIVGLLSIVFSK